jgi:hypothetical protein
MPTLDEIYARTEPLRLGQLIKELKEVADADGTVPRMEKAEKWVVFDWDYRVPVDLYSYRGYYDDVAIEAKLVGPRNADLGSFIKMLEDRVGDDMEGYKGGTFEILLSCRCWAVEDDSHAPGVGIVGVFDRGYEAVICTRVFE